MSEMGDWINQLALQGVVTRPPNENVLYGDPVTNAGNVIAEKPVVTRPGGERVPGAPEIPATPPVAPPPDLYGSSAYSPNLPAEYQAPPWAGDPGVPAPLADFLRHYASGYSTGVTPEMYQYFGGDNMLKMLQQFDPNARWVDTDLGGGEGASSTMGRRLEYNQGLLPTGAGPGWMSPVSLNSDRLRDPRMQYYDPTYGWVTDPRNVYHKSEGIEKWAPAIAAAISMGLPVAAPAAFGALGAAAVPAGFTSAVTGAAAGLPAASIPGSFAGLGGPVSATQAARPTAYTGAVRTAGSVGSQFPSMFRPQPAARVPAARNLPDTYGFDPSAFNAGGSTARTSSMNDSRLVANDFAADPYGFSRG